jgi:sortase A
MWEIFKKKESIILPVILVSLIVAFFIYVWLVTPPYDPEVTPEGQQFTSGTATSTWAIPTRFMIPKLNIDSGIQDVGITRSGRVGVPIGETQFEDVGWYRYGPHPGEEGNAIIVGHYDGYYSQPAVFYEVDTLEISDEVIVEYPDGKQVKFGVVLIETYPLNDAPLEKIFGNTSENMLNLITCNGEWNPLTKTYDRRTVVYTEMIE